MGVLCRTEQWKTHMKAKLKGAHCSGSKFDKEFILDWVPYGSHASTLRWYYQGRANSTIRYISDNTWEIVDSSWYRSKKEDEAKKKPVVGIYMAENRNAGLGRHKVTWENGPCGEKESTIVLSTCKDDEFVCE